AGDVVVERLLERTLEHLHAEQRRAVTVAASIDRGEKVALVEVHPPVVVRLPEEDDVGLREIGRERRERRIVLRGGRPDGGAGRERKSREREEDVSHGGALSPMVRGAPRTLYRGGAAARATGFAAPRTRVRPRR